MSKTNKEYAEVLKNQLAYSTIYNPFYPLNVDPKELLEALNVSIMVLENMEDDIVPVVRCKDCEYFRHFDNININMDKCIGYCKRPCESIVERWDYEFCSNGCKKGEKE